ncbi:extracellular solute-binding protein, family 3 [Klebsiella pneumoniae IS43]|uniref:Extracellular solute-binding protein, family 3 n=1 Tax=Klebsiella pneumoniae IS43 TaxID=1432552 RepID=W1DSG6_KLEPN|nr:extracellular solute-binding protein, family 3 [Klebsiella pneumoniae IS43]
MKKSLASMCLSAVLTVAFSYHAVAADLPEIEKVRHPESGDGR